MYVLPRPLRSLGFSHVAGSIMSQQSLTILNLGAARFEY